MKQIQCVGPTPCDEQCQQFGVPGYDPIRARLECRVYLKQLLRLHGEPPEGAHLKVHREAEGYLEVAVEFDDQKPDAIKYMLKIEGESPSNWDDIARKELGIGSSTPLADAAFEEYWCIEIMPKLAQIPFEGIIHTLKPIFEMTYKHNL